MMTVGSKVNKSHKDEHEQQLRRVCVAVHVAEGIMMLMMLKGTIM